MAGKKDKVKDNQRSSILVPDLFHCFVCGTTENIHIHEVFGGANRSKSKEDGMCIPLCGHHHNLSNAGIHFNKTLDEYVKKQAEKVWIETYADDEETKQEKISKFISRYGRNYLDEEEL